MISFAVPLTLPTRDGFYPHDSQEIHSLLGASVGAEVELPSGLGTKRSYVIQSITSAYRHLLQVAQERVHMSMSSDSAFFSVPVLTNENGVDFTHVHEVLKRQSDHSRMVMDAYQNGPLTLGIVARMLGRSVPEVVTGWPNTGPKLFVSGGTSEERQSSAQLLERSEAAYVVDAASITELTRIECQGVLAALPKVYCSTKTLEVLEVGLEEAQSVGESGRIFDEDGEMRFVEYSSRDNERRVKFIQATVDAVRAHCEVIPAYGPEALPEGLEKAEEILEAEEYSVLLLIAEKNATLLTVDGRLAQLATATFKRASVWPQVLIMHAVNKGLIQPRDYSQAIVRQFLSNRTFVSLTAYDLLWMVLQGGFTMRFGVQRLKEYLESPDTEFTSMADVVFAFLNLLAFHRSQVKGFAEILGHLVEAALRHPNADVEWFLAEIENLTVQLVASTVNENFAYPVRESMRQKSMTALRNVLVQSVDEAVELARRPDQRRAVRLDVLMCTKTPHLVFDGNVQETEAKAIAGVEAPNLPESFELNTASKEI